MRNDNKNGDWMFDGASQEQIVYDHRADQYCHEACAPDKEQIEVAYTAGGVTYYAGGRHGKCHYCGRAFVPEVMSGSKPMPNHSPLNQHFI